MEVDVDVDKLSNLASSRESILMSSLGGKIGEANIMESEIDQSEMLEDAEPVLTRTKSKRRFIWQYICKSASLWSKPDPDSTPESASPAVENTEVEAEVWGPTQIEILQYDLEYTKTLLAEKVRENEKFDRQLAVAESEREKLGESFANLRAHSEVLEVQNEQYGRKLRQFEIEIDRLQRSLAEACKNLTIQQFEHTLRSHEAVQQKEDLEAAVKEANNCLRVQKEEFEGLLKDQHTQYGAVQLALRRSCKDLALEKKTRNEEAEKFAAKIASLTNDLKLEKNARSAEAKNFEVEKVSLTNDLKLERNFRATEARKLAAKRTSLMNSLNLEQYSRAADAEKFAVEKKALEEAMDTLRLKHQEELDIREPIVKVGIATRSRFIENCKRVKTGSRWVNVRGKPDHQLIEAGNHAAHRGNFEADLALYLLTARITDTEKQLFKSIYGLLPSMSLQHVVNFGSKRLSMINMQATLASCFSHTNYTREVALDRRFTVCHSQCLAFVPKSSSDKSIKDFNPKFETDESVASALVEMQSIVEIIVNRYRRHCHS